MCGHRDGGGRSANPFDVGSSETIIRQTGRFH